MAFSPYSFSLTSFSVEMDFSESVKVGESFYRLAVFVRLFSEGLKIGEVMSKIPSKVLLEGLKIGEVFSKIGNYSRIFYQGFRISAKKWVGSSQIILGGVVLQVGRYSIRRDLGLVTSLIPGRGGGILEIFRPRQREWVLEIENENLDDLERRISCLKETYFNDFWDYYLVYVTSVRRSKNAKGEDILEVRLIER